MFTIEKTFKFDAAHRLHHLPKTHPCASLHGHSYKCKVCIQAKNTDSKGFVIEFGELKPIRDYLDTYFDHSLLIAQNDIELIHLAEELKTKHTILPIAATTSELMAMYLAEDILHTIFTEDEYDLNLILGEMTVTVTIMETENNKATYSRLY